MAYDFSKLEFNRPSASNYRNDVVEQMGAALLTIVILGSIGLLSGCNTTRFGQRSDSLVEAETEDESEESTTSKKSKGVMSLLGSWWADEESYEEIDVTEGDLNGRDKSGSKLADQDRGSRNANRNNLLSSKKKTSLNDEVPGSELTPEQQELLKKQYQAAKSMGWVDDPEIEAMLADMERAKTSNEELVSLPPGTSRTSANAGSIGNSNPTSMPVTAVASAVPAASAAEVTSATFRLSDSAPSPVMPAANSAPVNPAGAPAGAAASALPNFAGQIPNGQGVVNALATGTATSAGVQPANPNAMQQTPSKTDLKSLTLAPLPLLPSNNAPVPATGSQITNATPATSNNISISDKVVANPAVAQNAFATAAATPVVSASSTPSTTWEDDMQQAIQKLRDRLSDGKELTPKERQQLEARLRMMYLAANQLDSSLQPVESWDSQEKEWFRNTLQALYHAYDTEGPESRSRRFSLVAERQRAANQHLSAISNLEVRNLEFCSAVESYGLITRFPTNSFKADQMVLLYCEIENFAAIAVPEGYETEFKANYEIVDLAGNRVAEQSLPTDRQKCRNWRRDYFIAYRFHLPKDLVPGKYQLKLNIEDLKGKKFGQSSVDFTITP